MLRRSCSEENDFHVLEVPVKREEEGQQVERGVPFHEGTNVDQLEHVAHLEHED